MQPGFICVYLPAIMPAAWAVVSTPSPAFFEYFGFASFVPFITFLVFQSIWPKSAITLNHFPKNNLILYDLFSENVENILEMQDAHFLWI